MAKKKQQMTVAQQQQVFNFDVNKFENFNATVNELRTGIYAPIEKISHNSATNIAFVKNGKRRNIVSSWGEVNVLGNILTQTHRDLLDCVLTVASQPVAIEGGSVAYYFKFTDVLNTYNTGNKKNFSWVKKKLQEVQTTGIEFKEKDKKNFVSFNIIEKVAYSEEHELWGIVFSADYRKYVEQNLTLDYKEELPKLLKIDSALLKSIIRFFWTHKYCNISVEQMLRSIGYPIESERAIRTAKKEIKDNKEMLENEFGIYYNEKENFIYTQITDNINFIPPTKSEFIQLEN